MKILCPFHAERTPSCHIYEDHYYCFSCGARGDLKELEKISKIPSNIRKEKYVEPITETIQYICSLPKEPIRGFELHADSAAYYILWPNNAHYKKRFKDDNVKPKYKCPAGVEKPLFAIDRIAQSIVVICEGELNCMSIAECVPFSVCSPGSATEMYSPKIHKYLPYFKQFDTLLLVVDNDPAGAIAAIELKSKLVGLNKKIIIKLMKPDANDIYVQYGKQKLKEEIYKSLEL